MKVRVDHAKCETNALCVGMAPDLFELDGDHPVQVTKDISIERRGEVDQIVASCPTGALSVTSRQES